ncbi:hypothetical protein EVAR_14049_1 [Eumeta japonica]|uniref:Uncharacterized protein n=1 Tax=Eumeta variegata TaxID=151549 RepID=A0A4C1UN47_EUMVA|nr:hypothetical protein EVAR_14049_1 [Eumeta japonica]
MEFTFKEIYSLQELKLCGDDEMVLLGLSHARRGRRIARVTALTQSSDEGPRLETHFKQGIRAGESTESSERLGNISVKSISP